ncbi:MAG: hypothetical protein DI626_04985 [Micavibrio aeruginosavorus]|uniref:CBS domain-containing protein n=1 Tax=Micavibrio aeruginosavorus TaxID=349221 RepID=A0A2W4ZXH2_9BACT|nr:MAG: hypothetical protein DI626_04985 [Micavibrio aeruginosavorus]
MPDRLSSLFRFDLSGKTVPDTMTVAQAIDIMAERRANCFLVQAEGGRAVGVLSEHDIVTAFAFFKEKARETKIRDIMTIDIFAARENDSLDEALKVMADNNVRHLPVLSEYGNILDFLSITEIIAKKNEMYG